MIVYFCIELLCSCWSKHCKIILLHGAWIILNSCLHIILGAVMQARVHEE